MTVSAEALRSYADIRGWFPWVDRVFFSRLLNAQEAVTGDLVELGAFLGKSAVVIGSHLRDGERFVVVDLFGSEAALGDDRRDQENRVELQASYRTLTREQFEKNYLELRGTLPVIVQGLSTEVTEHVAQGTVRFMHIDASHLYEQVLQDARNARALLSPGGVVVFDDFRSPHTPGVAAAVWQSVLHEGLIPFAITRQKLYGVYDDPAPYLEVTRRFVRSDKRFTVAQSRVLDHVILRVRQRPQAVAEPPSSPVSDSRSATLAAGAQASTKTEAAKSAAPADRASMPNSSTQCKSGTHRLARTVMRDWCPPKFARWVRKQRRRARRRKGRVSN